MLFSSGRTADPHTTLTTEMQSFAEMLGHPRKCDQCCALCFRVFSSLRKCASQLVTGCVYDAERMRQVPTELCFENPLKSSAALLRQRDTCTLVWAAEAREVRTLKTKLGVSGGDWPPLRGREGHLPYTWYCWRGCGNIIQCDVCTKSNMSRKTLVQGVSVHTPRCLQWIAIDCKRNQL